MVQDNGHSIIYIKNMVCPRCIFAVDNLLKQNGIDIVKIELGKAEIKGSLSKEQKRLLQKELNDLGFELLDDKITRRVEQIKNAIIDFVHYQSNNVNMNLSDYIVSKLHQDYFSLSKIFSENESTTIEKYFILQKIERIKELLSYNELTLNEIALEMNYSSAAYLSTQFKQITGMTPSQYKLSETKNRKCLDSI